MITNARKKYIQQLARQKLMDHDAMCLPVYPSEFAKTKLDIVVQAFDPPQDDISGFLMQKGDAFGIGYSRAIQSKGFQNFTVAHELGHYFIDGHAMALLKNGKHLSRSGYISKDYYEREADTFATEFLMPWKLIDSIIRQNDPGFGVIKTLSEACESSLLASAIRYASVSRECVAVVVSHQGVVEFMTASDSFRSIPGVGNDWLRRDALLPQRVPSVNLGVDRDWVARCAIVEEGACLCDWFSGAPNLEVEEDIVGLGSYGRLLTVLITDWAEEEHEEDETGYDSYIERMKMGVFRKRK